MGLTSLTRKSEESGGVAAYLSVPAREVIGGETGTRIAPSFSVEVLPLDGPNGRRISKS